MGTRWLEFFRTARGATAESIDNAIRFSAGPSADRPEAARRLGEFKQRLFLQIAIADLIGRLDVAATMGAMSRLADECIAAALECARLIVGRKAPAAEGFCVLGMGKLGAQELNLSSDIDLIYVFDGPDADAEAVARLGETLTELLSPGCFRVDMRLRPGGRNAPLVTPFEGALGFYQSFGETWERAALLRARAVAGVLEVGERLLGELSHFVYRRYLDFDTLRQLRAMKLQIERELRSPDLVARNIKLGYGGIRELEFIVQALILVYGGRDPRLRTARTLAALERLGALGYLNPGRASELAAAYLFLRDVEHKLQVVAALQTHVLPAGDAGRRALTARMHRGKGAAANARFEAEIIQPSCTGRSAVSRDAGRRRGSRRPCGFRRRRTRVAHGARSAPVRADAAGARLRAAAGERGTFDARWRAAPNTRSRRLRRAGASCSNASAHCCSTRFASSPTPISR